MKNEWQDGTRFRRAVKIPGIDGKDVTCDIFNPWNNGGLRPALVFIHGGGFVGGSKDQFLGWASWLSLVLGALSVTVQYRTAKKNPAPAPIVDCLSVFQWIKDNARDLEVDLRLVFVIGGSPGANIGAMAMMADSDFLSKYKIDVNRVFQPDNGIFINGIFDLHDFYERNPGEREHVLAYMGRKEYDTMLGEELSPVRHPKPGLHILLLHGSRDAVVPSACSMKMKKALECCNSEAVTFVFDGRPHAWFNAPEEMYEVLEVMLGFINKRKDEVGQDGAYNSQRVIYTCNRK